MTALAKFNILHREFKVNFEYINLSKEKRELILKLLQSNQNAISKKIKYID